MILALYFTQVVPQNYGVAKHWLFPIKELRCRKQQNA